MSIVIARQLSICGLCVVLAAAGCTLSPPPATPTPTSAQEDSTSSPANTAASWRPRLSAGSWRYELLSTATVTLTGDPSASALPISRTTVYTVSIAPTREPVSSSVPFEVVGSVDSVAVTTPGRIPTPTAGSDIRPHFRAELGSDGRVVNLTSNATTACQAAVDPLSAAALTLFVTLPPALSVGASWKDTLSTVTCRGRMAVITTAIRQYKVVTDTVLGRRPALLLRRMDSLDVRNRADTASGQMTAAGTGSAAFLLYVDPASGMLLNATGESHTEILVIAGDTRYPFREDAKQTIALLH